MSTRLSPQRNNRNRRLRRGLAFAASIGAVLLLPATGSAAVGHTAPSVTVTIAITTEYGLPYGLTTGITVPDPAVTYTASDGSDQSSHVTGTLVCSGASAELTALTTAGVGFYQLPNTCHGLVDPGYTVSYNQSTSFYRMVPAPLIVTASSASMLEGSSVPAVTPSYAGFRNGDTASSLVSPATCSTTATVASSPGDYSATCSGAISAGPNPGESNYQISYQSGTVHVVPSDFASRLPVEFAKSGSNLGDLLLPPKMGIDLLWSGSESCVGGILQPAIVASEVSSAGALEQPSETPCVNKAAKHVVHHIPPILHDTMTYTGLWGQTVTCQTAYHTGSGTIDTFLCGGAVAFTPTFNLNGSKDLAGGRLVNVTKKPFTDAGAAMTPRGANQVVVGSSLFGGMASADAVRHASRSRSHTRRGTPTVTVTVHASTEYGLSYGLSTGLHAGDPAISYVASDNSDQSGHVTGTLTCSVPGAEVSALKTGGAGPYQLAKCSGLKDTGYTVQYDLGNSRYEIMQAPLIITASSDVMTQGGSVPDVTPVYSGFRNGDGPSSVSAPTCSTTATSASTPGTYPTTCHGASSASGAYAITYIGGFIQVRPADLGGRSPVEYSHTGVDLGNLLLPRDAGIDITWKKQQGCVGDIMRPPVITAGAAPSTGSPLAQTCPSGTTHAIARRATAVADTLTIQNQDKTTTTCKTKDGVLDGACPASAALRGPQSSLVGIFLEGAGNSVKQARLVPVKAGAVKKLGPSVTFASNANEVLVGRPSP